MPQGDTFHGFMLYLIGGFALSPLWVPIMMAVCAAFMVFMIVYGFIFAPIRWAVIGIRKGDWHPDNFQRTRPAILQEGK